ncbi:hypothetical protein E8K88_02630 [Lampropedia aestuarii]|uniref:Uncharacterized protein n=1 Tax=Lampropedia aestuarii TaxID=2562762 RepID=A0A4S5C152_9BURK|nr:hypothetical protein [Lampropedia aestuarii]THJ36178.1 hypothetical protein E8K88_02630 [Lampropedia aestuarii]
MSLSPQEAAALLAQAELGDLSEGQDLDESEQGNEANNGGENEAAEAAASAPEKQDTAKNGLPDGEQVAPIASRSGAYTIPYEKLTEARDAAKTAQERIDQLERELQELRSKPADAASASQNLQTAQEAIEQGVDVSIFGDFSEEGLAKGVQTLMAKERALLLAEIQANQKQTELAEQSRTAEQAHFDAIFSKHPDASEVYQSEQFSAWIATLPPFAAQGVQHALQSGTATQVNEVLDAFKGQASASAAQPAKVAKAPEVQRYTPASLSEVAGAPPKDETQQVLESAGNPSALLDRMHGMTPEQIDSLLDKI